MQPLIAGSRATSRRVCTRSRIARFIGSATHTAINSPTRCSFARLHASVRSVLIRSSCRLRIEKGVTTDTVVPSRRQLAPDPVPRGSASYPRSGTNSCKAAGVFAIRPKSRTSPRRPPPLPSRQSHPRERQARHTRHDPFKTRTRLATRRSGATLINCILWGESPFAQAHMWYNLTAHG